MAFSEEQKAKWEVDSVAYTKYRKEIESGMNSFDLYYAHTEAQKEAFNSARDLMHDRLRTKPELCTSLVPGFAIECRS